MTNGCVCKAMDNPTASQIHTHARARAYTHAHAHTHIHTHTHFTPWVDACRLAWVQSVYCPRTTAAPRPTPYHHHRCTASQHGLVPARFWRERVRWYQPGTTCVHTDSHRSLWWYQPGTTCVHTDNSHRTLTTMAARVLSGASSSSPLCSYLHVGL